MGKKFTLSLLVLAAMLLALPIQAQNAFVAKKALPSKVMKGIHGQELKKGYTFVAKNVKEVAAQARLTAEQKALCDRMIELSHSRTSLNGWTWRTIFRSETVDFDEGLTEEDVLPKIQPTEAFIREITDLAKAKLSL